MALRYYFDLVCPYSYILANEVEEAEDEGVLREVAGAAGLDEEAAVEAAWDPDRISALRFVREVALSIGVHGVPSVATEEEVLYYGAASPGKIHALLANR